jgi:GTP cyclohydrolase I
VDYRDDEDFDLSDRTEGPGRTSELTYGKLDKSRVEAAVREFLFAIGEDPDRPGLVGTPDRVARACEEIFGGMQEDPGHYLRKQFHEPGNEEMVVVRDIPFASMCEHHILPFMGKASVCYIPRDGRITGLSKIARCVTGYAHRPQLQERLTSQIADAMVRELNPLGVLVVIQAEHTCMTIRGIRTPGAQTVTSAVRGTFKNDMKTRAEALRLLGL